MDMMHFFMNMKKAEGITSVLVTHNADLAKHTKQQLKMQNGPIRTQQKKAGGYSPGLFLQTYYPFAP